MQPLITSSHCTSEKNLLSAQFLLSLSHWHPTCVLLWLCRHLLHFSVSVRHLFMKAWKLKNQTRSVQKLTSFIPFSESWELYSSILFRTSSSDRSFVLLSSSSFASFCCKSRERKAVSAGSLSLSFEPADGAAPNIIPVKTASALCCFAEVHE